jgi:hypothetical protein
MFFKIDKQANKNHLIIEIMMGKSMQSKINLLFILFLLLIVNNVSAQTLSLQAEISVLTFGPGKTELYSAYGHSAIRVHDPVNGFDAAYNYGTFDFDQPNFYLNFTRGHLIYKLSVQDARRLNEYYQYNDRSITEQVLNLTPRQKIMVFGYLQNNAKPENADYNYDYFYDNCATRILYVFQEALGEEISFDDNFVDEPGLTVRELTDRYSAVQFPWGKLGIDICLGMPMDKKLTNIQYTYIPAYVFKAFSIAQVQHEGTWLPVVQATNNIYVSQDENKNGPFYTPKLVFWSFWLLVVIISLVARIKKISLRWFDLIFFLAVGLLGLLLLLLWVATDHTAAAWNLNLLWAWPTHLFIAFWLLKKVKPWWLNWYLLFTAILGVALVILWLVVPQALNMALIPIALVIVTRASMAILE